MKKNLSNRKELSMPFAATTPRPPAEPIRGRAFTPAERRQAARWAAEATTRKMTTHWGRLDGIEQMLDVYLPNRDEPDYGVWPEHSGGFTVLDTRDLARTGGIESLYPTLGEALATIVQPDGETTITMPSKVRMV